MDVVKPDNLNIEFLREFMMLPTSYYEPGAALKFRKFFLYKIPRFKLRRKVRISKLRIKYPSYLQRTSFNALELTILRQGGSEAN